MKEVDFQTKIAQSLTKAGGYGRKWTSEWQAGPPDLILSHPTTGAFFMEVKLIKEPPAKFDRALGLTAKQQIELARLDKAGARVLLGVVVYYGRGRWDLVALEHRADRLASPYRQNGTPFRSFIGGTVDVVGLAVEFFHR